MRRASYVFATLTLLFVFGVCSVSMAAPRDPRINAVDPADVDPRIDPVSPQYPPPCGPCTQASSYSDDWVKVKCYCWKKGHCGKKTLVVCYKWVKKTTSSDDSDFAGSGDQTTGEGAAFVCVDAMPNPCDKAQPGDQMIPGDPPQSRRYIGRRR